MRQQRKRRPLDTERVGLLPSATSSLPAKETPSLIEFTVGNSAPMLRADSSLLSSFVFPLTPDTFKEAYLPATKAVAFLGGGERRVQNILEDLLCDGNVATLAATTSSDRIHCWMRPLGDASSLDTVKVEDAASAMTLHAAGASLYHRAPQEAERLLVPALCEGIDAAFAAYFDAGQQAEPRGEVEVFVSRRGHVTTWHTDFQTNFTMQLRGTKTWHIKHGTVISPLRGATPHFTITQDVKEQQVKLHRLADSEFDVAPAGHTSGKPGSNMFNDCSRVTLNAGDLLFFPAGAWHYVKADTDSLSINVSLVPQTWGDLGVAAVRHMLLRETTARRGVTVPWPVGGAVQPWPVGGVVQRKRAGRVGAMTGAACAAPVSSSNNFALPHALRSHLTGLLATLRDAVARLKPEDLVPPASLLSFRYDDAVVENASASDAAESEDEVGSQMSRGSESKETDSLVTTACPPAASIAVSSYCAEHGIATELRGGTVHLLRVPHWQGRGVPTSPSRTLRINPLSLVIPCDDLSLSSHPSEGSEFNGPAAKCSARLYTVLVNFGFGEDFAPQSRVILHVPTGREARPRGGQDARDNAGSKGGSARGRESRTQLALEEPRVVNFPVSVMKRVVYLTSGIPEGSLCEEVPGLRMRSGDRHLSPEKSSHLDLDWAEKEVLTWNRQSGDGDAECTAADARCAIAWLASALTVAGVATCDTCDPRRLIHGSDVRVN